MQVTQADESSCKRVGVEEHLIKFKSSPNFKNMKKYIRSRSETTSLGSPIPAALGAPEPPPPPNLGEKGHLLRKDWHTSEVQPPLPLDPPPPDYVPNLKVKQEVVDTEYEGNRLSPTLENQKDGNTEQTNDRSNEICRDFIRGTCKREGTCKYAHKHDLSQLEGVYTFCRKFQNSVCTFTHCKYVHATVFEEQHFYRTGVLPDHALHHRTNNNILQPPPPPPPPEEPPAVPPLNIDFSNPPPPFRNEIEPPMINISARPVDATCYMRDMHNQMPTQSLSQSISPLKREWSNLNTFTAPPSDLAYNEQLSKKCKHCDVVEFRLDHNKDKLKKGLQSKEQLSKNIVSLEKQSEKLRNLISELLRPTISSSTYRQINDLKYKNLMEQLNSFLSANNRSSTLGEDK